MSDNKVSLISEDSTAPKGEGASVDVDAEPKAAAARAAKANKKAPVGKDGKPLERLEHRGHVVYRERY